MSHKPETHESFRGDSTDAKLRILIVEDVPNNAELAQRELRKAKMSFVAKRVETREAFLDALESFSPDLILSDYALPAFDGMTALRLANERAPEVPVIMLTGSINEETAVECMKAGASDYVLKDHLVRLAPAVESALDNKRNRDMRRRAEEALRNGEKRYRDLVETSNDLIWSMDIDGRWTFLNRQATQRIYGYEIEEMLGRRFTEFQTDEQAAEDLKVFEHIKAGQPHIQYETAHLRKDGSPVYLSFNAIVLHDAAGHVIGTTGTAADITDRRTLDAQLRQAQKMQAVGRLAGGVAHEFNNLLTVILGESEEALKAVGESHAAHDSLKEIEAAGERAALLTRQLLAFSRQQTVEPTVFSLDALVTDLDKTLRLLISAEIELTTRTVPDLGPVKADRRQIEQVLVNLVANARSAMLGGGKLSIETANTRLDEEYTRPHADLAPGDYVVLAVRDTGTGMSEEVLSQLFEPFFTTQDPGSGTGLGLSTCHGIVKQHGGHIEAHSEVGVGTTMKVYLPRVRGEVAEPSPATPTPTQGSETILLVEDDAAVRGTAVRMLQRHGYTELQAGDGNEALRLLKEYRGPLHLLLTDVVMPGMGGRELADRVTDLVPGIKVLFASGYTDDVILRQRLLDGGRMLMHKPFTAQSLATKVREVLDG